MIRRRTIRITVATEETWVLGQPSLFVEDWCETCSAAVRLLAPERAATCAGLSARDIYRAVENQMLHFNETSDGKLLICLNSLSSLVSKETPGPFAMKRVR